MKVQREQLLNHLESVSAGLATKDIVEQSSCFVFLGGRIFTFNDELSCSIQSPIKIKGAIAAKPILELLSKMKEDEIDVSQNYGNMIIRGISKMAKFNMQSKISLPINEMEIPTNWIPLNPEFSEAVDIVQTTAARGVNASFNLTCIHITPKLIESCDNHQATRYPLDTGIKKDVLIRQPSIKHVAHLGMNEVSCGENWLHFRNPSVSDLVLSCRYTEQVDYQDLNAIFEVEGIPATLPSGLEEAADKAQIFTQEQITEVVTVQIQNGELILKGVGTSGEYVEKKKVKFKGDVTFCISPKLLSEIVNRANDCLISEKQLKVDTGKFIYVTSLVTD